MGAFQAMPGVIVTTSSTMKCCDGNCVRRWPLTSFGSYRPGPLASISKPRLSTRSEFCIFNRFPRGHYLVWWVRVGLGLALGLGLWLGSGLGLGLITY